MTLTRAPVRRKCGYCHIWPDPDFLRCACDDPQAWRTRSPPSRRVNVVDTITDAGFTVGDLLELLDPTPRAAN